MPTAVAAMVAILKFEVVVVVDEAGVNVGVAPVGKPTALNVVAELWPPTMVSVVA